VEPVGGALMGPTSQSEFGESERPRAAQGRALVKVSQPSRRAPTHLPGAGFLAQLIACDQKMPQTRERRRAEPQEAAKAYSRVSTRGPYRIPSCFL
jgi:hypothetical protein